MLKHFWFDVPQLLFGASHPLRIPTHKEVDAVLRASLLLLELELPGRVLQHLCFETLDGQFGDPSRLFFVAA